MFKRKKNQPYKPATWDAELFGTKSVLPAPTMPRIPVRFIHHRPRPKHTASANSTSNAAEATSSAQADVNPSLA